MPSIALLQANGVAQTTAAGGSISVSQAFSSNNTAGSMIVVFAFFNSATSAPSLTGTGCTDTQGNSYTQEFFYYPGFSNVMTFAYVATNVHAGANTVTFACNATGGTTACLGILIAEYSGAAGATVISNATTIFGSNPTVISLTDQYGNSVSDTFTFSPGHANEGAYALDIAVGAADVRICAAFENNLTGVSDSVTGTMSAAFTTAARLPGIDDTGYLQLWDGTPYTLPQVQPAAFVTV